ncbi:MAG: hypothetical protein JWP87_4225, partial [Labilithrix sp.]|nr:hypothetical protein [Labilithrix sp.]
MRKGRSQRKARGSLPPLSTRAHAQAADGAQAPQVTIGLTGPRSEPESTETPHVEAPLLETRGRETGSPAHAGATRSTLEIVREADRLELVREKSLEIVRESLELVRESLQEQESADEAPEPAAERAEAEAESEPIAIVTTPHVTALPTPEEMSIPPVGDLAVEPIAEQFFSEGEVARVHGVADDEEEWNEVVDRAARKSRPEVVQRRARFAKYVRWAVGGAAVVCLAALARTVVTPAKQAGLPVGGGAAAAALVVLPPAPEPEPKAATAA